MRSLGEADITAPKDDFRFSNEAFSIQVKFLKCNPVKRVAARSVVPNHIKPVFSPVIIMKQGWVESAGVHKNRIRPRAFNGGGGDQKIGGVFGRRFMLMNDGIAKIKQTIVVAQSGSPNATGAWHAPQVKQPCLT